MFVKTVVCPHFSPQKVIYMSGYTDNAIIQHGMFTSGVPFKQKPFSRNSLLQKVRQCSTMADTENHERSPLFTR